MNPGMAAQNRGASSGFRPPEVAPGFPQFRINYFNGRLEDSSTDGSGARFLNPPSGRPGVRPVSDADAQSERVQRRGGRPIDRDGNNSGTASAANNLGDFGPTLKAMAAEGTWMAMWWALDFLPAERAAEAVVQGGRIGWRLGGRITGWLSDRDTRRLADELRQRGFLAKGANSLDEIAQAYNRFRQARLAALAEANITNSGKTVLGHFPGYIDKANARGASYFNIGQDVWNALSDSERWALNRHFLDKIAECGDQVLVSVPKDQIREGSYLAREIEYLIKQKGYRWSNQWSLIRKI